jgi:hypothetical protein
VLQDAEKMPYDDYNLEMMQSDEEGYEKMIRQIQSGELLDDVAKEHGIGSPEGFFRHYGC